MSWTVFGHDAVVKILKTHLIQGDTRHAYLFSGIPGIGRRTLAIQFAQALNCTQPPEAGSFCGECRSCRQIAAQQHPDLSVVQSEAVGSILKIDEIRTLQQSLTLTPYEARWRVALLLRFEEANPNAQNALLKTLEEPAESVKLILTTSSEIAVLQTIASRCEVLRLRPANPAALTVYLADRFGIDQKTAETMAHLSAGRTGVAIEILNDPAKADALLDTARDGLRLFGQNIRERFSFAANFRDFRKRGELREVLQIWQSLSRDLLLLSGGGSTADQTLTFLPLKAEMEPIAARYPASTFRELSSRILQAGITLDANVSPQLLIEELLLNFPR